MTQYETNLLNPKVNSVRLIHVKILQNRRKQNSEFRVQILELTLELRTFRNSKL